MTFKISAPINVQGYNALTGLLHLSAWITDFTGATDQTANFQAAITAASGLFAAHGNPVTLYADKAGAVQVSSLTWASGVCLDGNLRNLKIQWTSTTAAAIAYLTGSPSNAGYTNPITDVSIYDVELDGSTIPATTSYAVGMKAIDIKYGSRIKIMRCYVHDAPATGIATDMAVAPGVQIKDNVVVNCGRLVGQQYTVTSVSGNVLTVSTNPASYGTAVGMNVGNFAGGLSAPGYSVTGNWPIYVSAYTATTITLSEAPNGTSGTFNVYNSGATPGAEADPGGSGIGIGTGGSTGLVESPPSAAFQQYNVEPQVVSGNMVFNCANYGIFHETQSSINAAGIVVTNNVTVGCTYGIGLTGSIGQVCTGNTAFGNSYYGIVVNAGTLDHGASTQTLIDGNTTFDNFQANICLDLSPSVSGYPHGFQTVCNNLVYGGRAAGILVLVGTTNLVRPTRIANNTVSEAGGAGISVAYNTGGTATLYNLDIIDNTVTNSGFRGAAAGISVGVLTNNCRIDGNRCFNDTATTASNYGLLVSTTYTGGSIKGNYFHGNTSAVSVGSNVSSTTEYAGNIGLGTSSYTASSSNGSISSVTPGASPWTYTAPGYPSYLIVTGGTVSAVTINTVTVPTSGIIPLEAADSVIVTYSSTPTVSSRPR